MDGGKQDKGAVRLEICGGTACYMLGGGELSGIGGKLPAEWRGRVEVVTVPCLNACRGSGISPGGAPFVRIGGHIVPNAGEAAVFECLFELLEPRRRMGLPSFSDEEEADR